MEELSDWESDEEMLELIELEIEEDGEGELLGLLDREELTDDEGDGEEEIEELIELETLELIELDSEEDKELDTLADTDEDGLPAFGSLVTSGNPLLG